MSATSCPARPVPVPSALVEPVPARAILAPTEDQARSGIAVVALLASVVVAFLASSAAPTPLYQHYVQVWHGTALTGTIAFGIYALAVLGGLLSLGRLADHLGRRPVLYAAIAAQVIALLLFATAGSFTPLLVGRVVQGLATGAALGTLGATMIEAHKVHGTLASAAAPGAGTGLGALVAGLTVGYLPWPTHLIYLVLAVVFVGQAFAVRRVIAVDERRPGVLASLRPQVAVPTHTRAAFLTAAPVLFAVWALAGFYGSLGPSLARQLAGSQSIALGGVGLFVLAGIASLTTIALRDTDSRRLMAIGVVTLALGVIGTIVAISADSEALYFVATAVAGIGFGAGFQGGLRTVVPLAGPTQRAGLLSATFVVSYLGLGGPAVLAGYLVSQGMALTHVASAYAAVLVLLALVGGIGLVRGER